MIFTYSSGTLSEIISGATLAENAQIKCPSLDGLRSGSKNCIGVYQVSSYPQPFSSFVVESEEAIYGPDRAHSDLIFIYKPDITKNDISKLAAKNRWERVKLDCKMPDFGKKLQPENVDLIFAELSSDVLESLIGKLPYDLRVQFLSSKNPQRENKVGYERGQNSVTLLKTNLEKFGLSGVEAAYFKSLQSLLNSYSSNKKEMTPECSFFRALSTI